MSSVESESRILRSGRARSRNWGLLQVLNFRTGFCGRARHLDLMNRRTTDAASDKEEDSAANDLDAMAEVADMTGALGLPVA